MKEIISMTLLPDITFLHLATSAGVEAARYALRHTPKGGINETLFLNDIELAVSEMFANAVRHRGRASGAKAVGIAFSFGRGILEVMISDRNPGFDLGSIPLPDIDTFPEGGYGLFLVKQVMDSLCSRREEGQNIFTMTKKITGKEES